MIPHGNQLGTKAQEASWQKPEAQEASSRPTPRSPTQARSGSPSVKKKKAFNFKSGFVTSKLLFTSKGSRASYK